MGSKCNICSTGEQISKDFSVLQIEFDSSKVACSCGSTRHVSCQRKQRESHCHIKHDSFQVVLQMCYVIFRK